MSALLDVEVLYRGLPIPLGQAQVRVDLDDSASAEQLDEHLRAIAGQHGHGPVGDYSLRATSGGRVVLSNFKTTA